MEQTVTLEQLQAQIAALTLENAKLIRKANAKGSIKVSDKGAVSVYGLGRFPVTLYASQWQALFERQDEIKDFIMDHTSELASKGEKEA